jgi:DNA polymerase I-like protein with 3'-5' exonuclease and polymerase domains
LYYCEEPKIIDGRLRDFSYKMTNYLIQGSAADQTKDAVIRYHENGSDKVAPMLLSVHDELVILVKESNSKKAMFELKKAMDAAGLDVPMVSEGEMGPNWADMKSTKD